jgi:hypothetical protein
LKYCAERKIELTMRKVAERSWMKLHTFHSSENNITIIKFRRMRWDELVVLTGGIGNECKVLIGIFGGIDNF